MREREETRDRKERQGDVDDTNDLLRSLMDLSEQKDLLERERERDGKKGRRKIGHLRSAEHARNISAVIYSHSKISEFPVNYSLAMRSFRALRSVKRKYLLITLTCHLQRNARCVHVCACCVYIYVCICEHRYE